MLDQEAGQPALVGDTAASACGDNGIPLTDAFRTWVRIGLSSFGGPAGQIAVMHRILVEEKEWISENRFLHALNYCMLLPGPEAQQLATYVGWLVHRRTGGLMAGLLFIIPGFLAILGLSLLYLLYTVLGDVPVITGMFFGLQAAVLAIVVGAVIRIGRRTLKNVVLVMLAACAFVAIFVFEVAFPLIIIGAATIGLTGGRFRPDLFHVNATHAAGTTAAGTALDEPTPSDRPSWSAGARTAALWLTVWLVPVFVLMVLLPVRSIWVQEAIFFSKAAVVTFGGAYAVLSYVAQQAVETYGWLQPGEMLDGLGMAETTPGPLIQVVQFVGFMGAYREPGVLHPIIAGVFGSILTTWVTFAPCFMFIFVGGPWIEHLRGNRALTSAFSGITAAVVGVVLNLSLWFSLHVLFGHVREIAIPGGRLLVPQWSTVDLAALLVTAGAFLALLVLRLGVLVTILLAVVAGLLLQV